MQDVISLRARAEQMRAEFMKDSLKRAFGWLSRLAAGFAVKAAERRLVSELSQLDDRALQDIGVERFQLQEFARRAVANENRWRDAA